MSEIKVGLHNEANRYKWLEETLKKIPSGNSILDAGAGELKFKKYCGHLEYVSQDFGQYSGEGDGKGFQKEQWDTSKVDIVSDIVNIPVEDASFDAIMCNEVLEHVPDPNGAMKEMDRILKPGGYLIITTPFNSLTHFAPYHFSTGFSRYYYEKHLGDLNYETLDLNLNGNYFEYLGQELRRLPKIANKYSGLLASRLTRLAINYLLKFLQKSTEADKGSNELLIFGIQIFARKPQ